MKNLFVTTLALAGFFTFNVMAQNSLQISPDEIQKSLEEMTNKEFQKIDVNGDGEIAFEEYRDYLVEQTLATSAQSFARIDKNNDKKISTEEYAAFMSGFTTKFQGMIQDLLNKKAAEAE